MINVKNGLQYQISIPVIESNASETTVSQEIAVHNALHPSYNAGLIIVVATGYRKKNISLFGISALIFYSSMSPFRYSKPIDAYLSGSTFRENPISWAKKPS